MGRNYAGWIKSSVTYMSVSHALIALHRPATAPIRVCPYVCHSAFARAVAGVCTGIDGRTAWLSVHAPFQPCLLSVIMAPPILLPKDALRAYSTPTLIFSVRLAWRCGGYSESADLRYTVALLTDWEGLTVSARERDQVLKHSLGLTAPHPAQLISSNPPT